MIVVTAATGKLGTHVVEQLLDTVPASTVRVAVRTPSKAAAWAARGVQVARADYTDPASLRAAFEGADAVLLISSSEVGQRAVQHQNAIDAAADAGVGLIVYTSILHADTTRSVLAQEHRATEAALAASGVPHVILRNGWYTENYTENLGAALGAGAFYGAAGDGRIAAAARADFAAAAVVALTTPGHAGKVYELAGSAPFTMAGLAAEVSSQTGRDLPYVDLPEAQFRDALVGAGLPAPFAGVLANADTAIAHGDLDDDSGTLARLIGRPTTPLAAAVRQALAS